jgi:hypothetical protein
MFKRIAAYLTFLICVSTSAQAELIGHWELSQDYQDSSGKGHHGTGFGGSSGTLPPFSGETGGVINGSANFNNSNYIALQQSFQGAGSLPEMSASAWFRTGVVGENEMSSNWSLLDFDRSEFFNFYISASGKVGFSTTSETSLNDMYGLTSNLNDNEWHHVAVTYGEANGKSIYVDGKLDRTVDYHGALGHDVVRYGFIGDGSEATTFNGSRNSLYYEGDIASVKLWDNEITTERVAVDVLSPYANAQGIFTVSTPLSGFAMITALGLIGFLRRKKQ